MARPLRIALAAAGAALVVAVVPLAAGALLAPPATVCIDDRAVPRTAPSRDQDELMQRDHASRTALGLPTDAAACRLAVEAPHRAPPPAAWIAVLLASAGAGAAAWWLAGGTRPKPAPAAGAAATHPPPQSPSPAGSAGPVGPVTLTPFGEHGGYVDLPHGVVVWATQHPAGPATGRGLRPGEPVHIRPAPRHGGWVVGRDTFTPGGSDR